jgi:2'-5' RNA ligase
MARVRTFIAVEVSDAVRSAAAALQLALAKGGAEVNWTPADNFHLTLLFLGEVDDREVHAICGTVGQAVGAEPPFAVRVSGVGAFPTPRRPKVLWAGIADGAAELVRLYALMEQPLIELGCYRREERGYTPHLTLGRVKGEADGTRLAAELPRYRDWAGGVARVDEVVVFASELRRDGPAYTPLGRAALRGRPAAG